jgi:hypothetical protein
MRPFLQFCLAVIFISAATTANTTTAFPPHDIREQNCALFSFEMENVAQFGKSGDVGCDVMDFTGPECDGYQVVPCSDAERARDGKVFTSIPPPYYPEVR